MVPGIKLSLILVMITGFVIISPISAGSMHEVEPVFVVTDTFLPAGFMGDLDAITVSERYSENTTPGATQNECTKMTYSPEATIRNNGWAGIYWLYPVHPEINWGNDPGYNVSGYSQMTFRARGEDGGEVAEFKFGGIDVEGKPYRDSVLPPLTTQKVTLESQWNEFSFDLTKSNLTSVLGGFCWVATKSDNPDGCVVYVDDIILK